MAIDYIRHGLTHLHIDCPDGATADLFEALCDLWVTGEQLTGTDLGNLDRYNAARLRLQMRLEQIGEQIDALDVMNNPQPITAAMDALKAEKQIVLRVLRATELNTNPVSDQ